MIFWPSLRIGPMTSGVRLAGAAGVGGGVGDDVATMLLVGATVGVAGAAVASGVALTGGARVAGVMGAGDEGGAGGTGGGATQAEGAAAGGSPFTPLQRRSGLGCFSR